MARKRRRAPGEGSIYKRKSDGRWTCQLVIGYKPDGKPRTRNLYGKTQAEVRAKLDRLRADKEVGRPVDADSAKLKLGTFLEDHWIAHILSPRVKPSTLVNYEGLVRLHIVPYLGGVALAKLGKLHIVEWHTALERAGTGARTRQAAHRALHRALKDAVDLDLVRMNVAASVDTPRAPEPERRSFTPEQMRAILDESESDPVLGPITNTIAASGMRIQEAQALTWGNVDFREGTVRITRAASEVRGKIIMQEPKSKRSKRTIKLSQRAIDALQAHRARLGAIPHPTMLVFTDSKGGPWRKSNLLRRHLHPLLKRLGVPQAGWHAFRHGHATALLESSANPLAVSARLGHAKPSLVLDVYGHVLPGADRKLADRMDAILGEKA